MIVRRYTEFLRSRPKVLCTFHPVMKVYNTFFQVTDDYERNYNTCIQAVWMILSVGKAHFIKYWWNFRSGTHFSKYRWLCLKVQYISLSNMDDYVYRFSTFHQVLMKFPKVEHISLSIYENFWSYNNICPSIDDHV